jgi:hypothetical protein
MDIQYIESDGVTFAEVTGEKKSIRDMASIMDLIGDIAFNHRCDKVLVDRKLIDESFFDLKSGFAGELTQKITNYRMKLAVVGDFSWVESLALKAYIYESNLGKTVRFTSDRDAAVAWLKKV